MLRRLENFLKKKKQYAWNNYKKSIRDTHNDAKYKGKKGQEKWLDEMYGNDWHDKEYMKKVYEITDPYQHAKTEIPKHIKYLKSKNQSEVKYYKQEAEEWAKDVAIFSQPIDKISRADYKRAKKFAKKYDKL